MTTANPDNTTPKATQARVQATVAQHAKAEVVKKIATLERLAVEYVPVEQLEPNRYNPNRQAPEDFELLKRSMTEDGFTQPIIALRATKQIVDGEHRWRAAKELGLAMVPVVFVNMTPEQMRVSTLRHNRARGTEDVDLSAEVLRDLQKLGAIGWAQESLMLDDKELNRLLSDVRVDETLGTAEGFSQAWIPDDSKREQDLLDSGADMTKPHVFADADRNGPSISCLTEAAVEAVTNANHEANGAASEEARQKLMRTKVLYRIKVRFSSPEAKLVKAVLGDHPATALLALCRKRVANVGGQPGAILPEPPIESPVVPGDQTTA